MGNKKNHLPPPRGGHADTHHHHYYPAQQPPKPGGQNSWGWLKIIGGLLVLAWVANTFFTSPNSELPQPDADMLQCYDGTNQRALPEIPQINYREILHRKSELLLTKCTTMGLHSLTGTPFVIRDSINVEAEASFWLMGVLIAPDSFMVVFDVTCRPTISVDLGRSTIIYDEYQTDTTYLQLGIRDPDQGGSVALIIDDMRVIEQGHWSLQEFYASATEKNAYATKATALMKKRIQAHNRALIPQGMYLSLLRQVKLDARSLLEGEMVAHGVRQLYPLWSD